MRNIDTHAHHLAPVPVLITGDREQPVAEEPQEETASEVVPTDPLEPGRYTGIGMCRSINVKQHASTVTSQKVSCGSEGIGGFTDNSFVRIREMCEADVFDHDIDTSPQAFAENRKCCWPSINASEMDSNLVSIYESVKEKGLPNALGAQVLVPSKLNLHSWDKFLDQSADERELFSFIKYGFPLGYTGPVSDTQGVSNHKSASDFPSQLDKFVEKEISMGGIIGPHPPIQGVVPCLSPHEP